MKSKLAILILISANLAAQELTLKWDKSDDPKTNQFYRIYASTNILLKPGKWNIKKEFPVIQNGEAITTINVTSTNTPNFFLMTVIERVNPENPEIYMESDFSRLVPAQRELQPQPATGFQVTQSAETD